MQKPNSSSASPRGRNAAGSQSASSPSQESTAPQQNPAASPEEEIARRAYARWESSDRSHGRDQEHWFAAENEYKSASRGDAQDETSSRRQEPSDERNA